MIYTNPIFGTVNSKSNSSPLLCDLFIDCRQCCFSLLQYTFILLSGELCIAYDFLDVVSVQLCPVKQ